MSACQTEGVRKIERKSKKEREGKVDRMNWARVNMSIKSGCGTVIRLWEGLVQVERLSWPRALLMLGVGLFPYLQVHHYPSCLQKNEY